VFFEQSLPDFIKVHIFKTLEKNLNRYYFQMFPKGENKLKIISFIIALSKTG